MRRDRYQHGMSARQHETGRYQHGMSARQHETGSLPTFHGGKTVSDKNPPDPARCRWDLAPPAA
ncbi:hypothetical protein DPV78_006390 [Talaromyces pinophilus]|nr:hypothetical protein DPV78_006390 [Talaromyces pinophilus]